MLVTIFDTETTGLPSSYNLEKDSWPYILQFSFVVYNLEKNHIEALYDEIIRLPPGVKISKESEKIHGISETDMILRGKPLEPLLDIFLEYCEKSELVMGHNVEFDFKMVCAELMRLKPNSPALNKFKYSNKYYCTMKSTVQLCNLKMVSKNGKEYTKYPTLKELHHHLFKTEPKDLHNALNDVLICFRCFYMIKYNEDILEKDRSMQCLLYSVVY